MPAKKETAVVDEGTTESVVPAPDAEEAQPVNKTFENCYAIAAAPFDKTYQRQIAGGRSMTYITGEQARSRLTEAYGHDWDWEIDSPIQITPTDVIVTGRLTVRLDDYASVIKAGVGSARVKFTKSGDVMDLGNDAKAAETSAFKRAAVQLGVGAYLYAKTEADEFSQPQAQTFRPPTSGNSPQFNAGAASSPGAIVGKVEFINPPGQWPDGNPKPASIKVNGAYYNVGRDPVDLSQFQRGQTIELVADGKYIKTIRAAGSNPVAPQAAEESGSLDDDF